MDAFHGFFVVRGRGLRLEELIDGVHWVVLGHTARCVAQGRLSARFTHFIFLIQFFNALLGDKDVSLVSLGRLSEVKGLLASLLVLEELVLQHGLEHVITLVVIVDARRDLPTALLRIGVLLVRVLHRRHTVRLGRDTIFEFILEL